MLDLAIRTGSGNRKSLDDAMRGLYQTYYKTKKRGFTDAEFREECERAAGGPLDEVFSYASTTKEADYAKYFALAGLETKVKVEDAPGAYLGVNVQTRDGKLVVTSVDAGSPAEAAGMRAGDWVTQIDGAAASVKALSAALAAKMPGDKLKLSGSRDIEATLGKNSKRTWSITPAPGAGELQNEILKNWLRGEQ